MGNNIIQERDARSVSIHIAVTEPKRGLFRYLDL